MANPLQAASQAVGPWSQAAANSIMKTATNMYPLRLLLQQRRQQLGDVEESLHGTGEAPVGNVQAAAAVAAAAASATMAGKLQQMPQAAADAKLQQPWLHHAADSSHKNFQVVTSFQMGEPTANGFRNTFNSLPMASTSSNSSSASDRSSSSSSYVERSNGSGSSTSSSSRSSSTSSSSSTLRFAKHLAVVSNGCAPPATRFESLGWLLFHAKQQQQTLVESAAAVAGLHADPSLTSFWLLQPLAEAKVHLLQQIYLIGQALADLGTADGLQPLSTSNGSRAIVSMDYAKLLKRYLQQHGPLLVESFIAELPDDELQVL
jgi:hypothetical protein